TSKDIQSYLGTCVILNKRRDGKRISVHVECKMSGDLVILGDVTFTLRDDHTLDFDDQDHTSPAVLHKCGRGSKFRTAGVPGSRGSCVCLLLPPILACSCHPCSAKTSFAPTRH